MLTKDTLRRAVNAACDCGGGEPGDCCPACEVWHALRLEEDQGERVAALEGELRDYERSMEAANSEIRDLKAIAEGRLEACDQLRDKLAASARKLAAVEAENREKCSELAEKAFEIRELRGVVDAAAVLIAAVTELDELWKRLAALDLDKEGDDELCCKDCGRPLLLHGINCPSLQVEPPALPRHILDLMAALKASLEVYDPHGMREFSAPGGFTAQNFGIRTEGYVVEVPAGTLMGQPVDLPPAAAEGVASVSPPVWVADVPGSKKFCVDMLSHRPEFSQSGGTVRCGRCGVSLRRQEDGAQDRGGHLVRKASARTAAAFKLLALLDSEEPPKEVLLLIEPGSAFKSVRAVWRWLREQVNGREMTGAEQTAAYENEIFEGD